jgi:AbrB family looped-hinge helix DNA binding protein
MNTLQSKVTSKGQVVIPKHIREHYGIKQSTVIRWVEKSEGVLMIPDTEDTIASARGMFKKSGMLKKLLAERARDRAKEAASGKSG